MPISYILNSSGDIDPKDLENLATKDDLNNKVDKSGDTMTGSLTVEHSNPESNIYTYSDKKTDYNSFNFKMEANHDTARVFGSGVRGENNARFSFDAKGRLSWGDGTNTRGFSSLDIDYTNRRLVASRMATAHTPSDQHDITNKKYVDEKIAAIPAGGGGTTDYNLLTNKPDLSTYATRQYVDDRVASIPAGGGGGGGSAVQDTGWINIPVPAGVSLMSGMQPRIRRIGNVVYVNITDLKFSTANEITLLNRSQLDGFKSIGRDTAPLWHETTIVGAVYAKYMGLGIQAQVGDWRYGTLSYITNDAFPTKRSF